MLGSYLARLSSTVVRSVGAPTVPPLGEVRLALTIWPTDVDVYLHVNNGRYLTLMDFGRLSHSMQTGLAGVMIKRRWIPVLGAATAYFWRELKTFDRVELVTRMVCWDEKWFFLEHRLERGGALCSQAVVKGLCRHRGRVVPPSELMAAIGHSDPSPPPPAWIGQWIAATPERPRRT